LSKETSKDVDLWLVLSTPSVELDKWLLEDLLYWSGLVDEVFFNLLL